MKTASKVMYIIGMISNVLVLALSILLLVLSIVGLVNPEFANEVKHNVEASGVPFAGVLEAGLGFGIYLFVSNLIVILIARRAIRNLNAGNGRVGAHIVLLIGGVLAWDPFYILGGIFGLIAS